MYKLYVYAAIASGLSYASVLSYSYFVESETVGQPPSRRVFFSSTSKTYLFPFKFQNVSLICLLLQNQIFTFRYDSSHVSFIT